MTALQHGAQIPLPAVGNEFAMFAKNSAEYFIVENRQKSGRDAALPDEGLTVWHVDVNGNNSNEQMTPSKHYELSLEQADGRFDLERSSSNLGDPTDLYGQANKRFADSTTPNSKWWDGTASNLDIFDIGAPGSVVSFKARLFQGGSQTVKGDSAPGLAIPDRRTSGITDTITLGQDATIAGVKVTLDISHTYRGDLRVTLLTPWGDGVVLHQRHQGGRADDIKRTIDESDVQDLATLHGHGTRGDWRLWVQDLARFDTGTLNRWALEFAATGGAQGPIVLEESPGTHIPDNDPTGIQRSLSTAAAGNVGSVEVSVDVTHTWIGDIQIALRSADGTAVVLHDEAGGSADDVVKTYTAATTPALAGLAGEGISGDWQLRVSDHAGADFGKLNSWRVVIHRAAP